MSTETDSKVISLHFDFTVELTVQSKDLRISEENDPVAIFHIPDDKMTFDSDEGKAAFCLVRSIFFNAKNS